MIKKKKAEPLGRQQVLLDTRTGLREKFVWPNMSNVKYIAIDTETTGLEVYGEHRLFGFSLANKNGAWYIPVRANNSAPNYGDEALQWLKQYSEDPRRTWIFFNAPFDMGMFRKDGIEFEGRCYDLAVLASLQNNQVIKPRLKQLGRSEGIDTGEEVDKNQYITKNKITDWSYVPSEFIEPYAIADADKLTFGLFKKIYARLDDKERKLFEIEARETKALFEMVDHGIKIDCDYFSYLAERYLAELTKIELDLAKHGIVATESDTIADYIRSAGLKVYAMTAKSGQISTAKESLDKYDDPVIEQVQEYKRVRKLYSTYAVRLLNNQRNGIIHPDYHQTGAITGRMSADLQQIPKKNPEIKRGFVPREGHVLITADYSQQEVRLLAHFSGDPFLTREYKKDPYTDIHQMIADLVGIERQQAKTLVFAIIYGAGIEKIAKQMGVSLEIAKEIRTNFYLQFPSLNTYRDRLDKEIRQNGFIRNIFGRRYRMDVGDYRAPNWQIQGSGSDIIKLSHARLNETYKERKMKSHVVMLVHDDIVTEAPHNEVDEIIRLKREIMTDLPMVRIPMIVDIALCPKNLYDKEPVK
jgi:DNA polymerase I